MGRVCPNLWSSWPQTNKTLDLYPLYYTILSFTHCPITHILTQRIHTTIHRHRQRFSVAKSLRENRRTKLMVPSRSPYRGIHNYRRSATGSMLVTLPALRKSVVYAKVPAYRHKRTQRYRTFYTHLTLKVHFHLSSMYKHSHRHTDSQNSHIQHYIRCILLFIFSLIMLTNVHLKQKQQDLDCTLLLMYSK